MVFVDELDPDDVGKQEGIPRECPGLGRKPWRKNPYIQYWPALEPRRMNLVTLRVLPLDLERDRVHPVSRSGDDERRSLFRGLRIERNTSSGAE